MPPQLRLSRFSMSKPVKVKPRPDDWWEDPNRKKHEPAPEHQSAKQSSEKKEGKFSETQPKKSILKASKSGIWIKKQDTFNEQKGKWTVVQSGDGDDTKKKTVLKWGTKSMKKKSPSNSVPPAEKVKAKVTAPPEQSKLVSKISPPAYPHQVDKGFVGLPSPQQVFPG